MVGRRLLPTLEVARRDIYRSVACLLTPYPHLDGAETKRDENGLLHCDEGPAYVYRRERVSYHSHGQYHRVGGPAIVCPEIEFDGFTFHDVHAWLEDDLFHRVDGPAYTDARVELWFDRGRLHRVGGPADQDDQGMVIWFEHGEVHRVGGPAVAHASWEIYCLRGMIHRIDGPAVVAGDGGLFTSQWFFLDEVLDEEVVRRVAATLRRALHRYKFRKFYRMMRWALSQEGAAALWSPESTCGRRAKQSLGSLVASMDLSVA